MAAVLTVHAPGEEPSRYELAGPATAGGSRADGILIPGAPPRALRLSPAAAGVVIEAKGGGVRVGGHPLHPGARRVLRPGERAELAGATLAAGTAPLPEGTRAAASPVLRGEVPGDGLAVVVLTGPRAGERHAVGSGVTAGRGRDASIRVPDPLASRVHLRIRPGPDGASVEDLRSKNGVRVNGVKIDRRLHPLRPGDEIALGETLLCLEDPWFADAGPGAEASRGAKPSAARAPAGARVSLPLAAALLLALSAAALSAAALAAAGS